MNYFRVCYIFYETVAHCLRTIFKQEWDKRYKAILGEWEDTPKNGLDFYHGESPKNQRRYARMLATMMNGNRESWDILMLIYAILHSDSLGSGLSEPVRSSVDELRKIHDEFADMQHCQLSDAEVESVVFKVQAAFQTLGLSTTPVEVLSKEKSFSTSVLEGVLMQSLTKLEPSKELQSSQVELQSKLQSPEAELQRDISSFFSFQLKPSHEIVGRKRDVINTVNELNKLKKANENCLSCLILSGGPGSGKSQLAGLVANRVYVDATKSPNTSAFVMLLNAENRESLMESYISLAQRLKCSESAVVNVLESDKMPTVQKIASLKELCGQKVCLYKTWLLVVDNVPSVRDTLALLPDPDSEPWKTGQLLITTRETLSDLPANPSTSHISLDKGMDPDDAICLLASISGSDDRKMQEEVARVLNYQPLALAGAATYVKQVCESNIPTSRAWTDYLEKLEAGKESFTENVPTPESSFLTLATTLLAVKSLMTNKYIRLTFTVMAVLKRDPYAFSQDMLIRCVQFVGEDQDKEQIRIQIEGCSLLLLGKEANTNYVVLHEVVYDAISSAVNDVDPQLRDRALHAVVINQPTADPLEENWDKFEHFDSGRLYPHLKTLF